MIWTALNISTAAFAAWIIAYVLVRHRGTFDQIQQICMGIGAAMIVLRTGPMLGKLLDTTSPFDNWSSTVMQVAGACFVARWAWKRERASAHR